MVVYIVKQENCNPFLFTPTIIDVYLNKADADERAKERSDWFVDKHEVIGAEYGN